jgi:hypothetical protein
MNDKHLSLSAGFQPFVTIRSVHGQHNGHCVYTKLFNLSLFKPTINHIVFIGLLGSIENEKRKLGLCQLTQMVQEIKN